MDDRALEGPAEAPALLGPVSYTHLDVYKRQQMSMPTRSAPARAKATAVARPLPRAAPVTTAALPRRHAPDFKVVARFFVIGISFRISGPSTRHRFPWICKFQKGSPVSRKKT